MTTEESGVELSETEAQHLESDLGDASAPSPSEPSESPDAPNPATSPKKKKKKKKKKKAAEVPAIEALRQDGDNLPPLEGGDGGESTPTSIDAALAHDNALDALKDELAQLRVDLAAEKATAVVLQERKSMVEQQLTDLLATLDSERSSHSKSIDEAEIAHDDAMNVLRRQLEEAERHVGEVENRTSDDKQDGDLEQQVTELQLSRKGLKGQLDMLRIESKNERERRKALEVVLAESEAVHLKTQQRLREAHEAVVENHWYQNIKVGTATALTGVALGVGAMFALSRHR